MSEPKLGYIGLGNQGAPMAKRLVDWPGGLVVFDVRADAMTPLAELGATPADSLADVAAAGAEDGTRPSVLRHLLRAVRHHESDAGAYRIAVEPYLFSDDAEALALVADAYLVLSLGVERQWAMLDRLDDGRGRLDSATLLTLGVRLSIEARDDLAARLVRTALSAGLRSPELPAAAFVLWTAGHRSEGLEVCDAFDTEAADWHTQAGMSLMTFMRTADADPATVLRLAASLESEGLITQPPAIGALVARLALHRMRAYASQAHGEEAALEARAVITYSSYRDYDLHMQGRNAEFDVRLVDRVQVTPDEVLEARRIIEAHSGIDPPRWMLTEGKLIREARP